MTDLVRRRVVNRLYRARKKLQLSFANIWSVPVQMDWALDDYAGYDDTRWQIVKPEWNAEDALKFLDYNGYGIDDLKDADEDTLVDKVREVWCDDQHGVPMMNYYYPIDLPYGMSPGEAQLKLELEGGATIMVEVNDEPALALAGGGMDLSWDICWGYILLGCYPPAHFCRLPDFASQKPTKKNLTILAACRISLEAVRQQAARQEKYLDTILESLIAEEAKANHANV